MHNVTVYPITGRQLGPIRIPNRWCEECDLTIRTVRRAVADLGQQDIVVEIKPWLRHIVDAVRRGGWHAPVVTVDGKVFSQGIVPDEDALKDRLRSGDRAEE